MAPPIFPVCAADAGVTALLGTAPVRLWPFGEAPQNPERPYAVWQIITGVPENYLDSPPDIDNWTLQVDIYASTATSTRAVRAALRQAIEPHAHIVRLGPEDRDRETRDYHTSFDVSWYHPTS